MKKLFYILFSLLYFTSFAQTDCGGKDQWDIKTLTDKDANKIDTILIKTTVAKLTKIPAPEKSAIRTKQEMKMYMVDCKIREYRKEDDGDYHLVLMDLKDSTLTIVAEIPDYTCSSVAKSKYKKLFKKSRLEFEKYKTANNKVQQGEYRIVGVAFYDKLHGQLGISSNGFELHPVLKFVKVK